jgi:diguanylate cyclase (GGDEF)-like protein
LFYLVLFFLLKVNLLFYFNLASVILYITAIIYNERKIYRPFYMLSHIEISVHSFLAVLCLGWQSNFGFFFIGISMLIIFIDLFKPWVKITEVVSITFLNLLAYILSREIRPLYSFDSLAMSILGTVNMTLFFLLCTYIIYRWNQLLTDRLRNMAEKDGLTGIYNRRFFNENLEIERRRMLNQINFKTTNETNFGIAMVDIDDFKKVNDRYGHITGDKVLTKIVRLMEESIFSRDILCRFGGEEFVILFISTPREGALAAIEKIRCKIGEYPFYLSAKKKPDFITVSIGFASFEEENDIFKLLGIADRRLYAAKAMGKNCVVSCD